MIFALRKYRLTVKMGDGIVTLMMLSNGQQLGKEVHIGVMRIHSKYQGSRSDTEVDANQQSHPGNNMVAGITFLANY